MDLVLFGMQGSGKGTLGKFLAQKYNLEIFETGGELRKLAKEDSELGKKVKSIIEAGHLVSDEVVMEIVENFMNNLETPNKGIIFDGIPRKIGQGEMLKDLLNKHQREYRAVILKISEETALKRLTTRRICEDCKAVYPGAYDKDTCEKCGGQLITRADDNAEAIKTRIEAFKKETIPAMELYNSGLIEIDGEGNIEEVQKLAIEKLNPILK